MLMWLSLADMFNQPAVHKESLACFILLHHLNETIEICIVQRNKP